MKSDIQKSLSQLSDEELIELFKNGKTEAFDELVSRFKNPLINFIYRFMGDYDESDDIVQDTFVKVYMNKHYYKSIAKFSTWIYTIASNLAKTRLRKKNRMKLFSFLSKDANNVYEKLADKSYNLEEIIEHNEFSEIVQNAIYKIPIKYREAVILRDLQEFTYEEIAEITNANIGTIKSRINRGREYLRKFLKDIIKDL